MNHRTGRVSCYKFFLLSLALSALLNPLSRQFSALAAVSDEPSFSASQFLEPIKFLAGDDLKGRGDGTQELDRAADYIAARFRKFGLKPTGDRGSYLQQFDLVI